MADPLLPKNNNDLSNENQPKPKEAHELDASQEGIDMFFSSEKEGRLFTEWGMEVTNTQLKESFLLYRIDLQKTKPHKVWGESKKKVYLEPVQIYGRINVETNPPEFNSPGGLVRQGLGLFTAHVFLAHLQEKEVEIRMGDFVYHKGNYYLINDDGKSNINNRFAYGSDKYFYITIKAVEVNSDVFNAR